MATGHLIEYLPSQPGKSFPVVSVFGLGDVAFAPNPVYGGRLVVEVPNRKHVDLILARNPPGQQIYTEPADLMTAAEMERTLRVVDEVTRDLRRDVEELKEQVAKLAKKNKE